MPKAVALGARTKGVATIDRPSTAPANPSSSEVFLYRISPAHAQDIAAVLARVNTGNLDVFLVGSSASAISVIASHKLGSGISFSNAGHSSILTNLQPRSVTVPVQMLVNTLDECSLTNPADAPPVREAFLAGGVPIQFNTITGGFVTDPDPCTHLTFHGFQGIETMAAQTITTWLDGTLAARRTDHPGNHRPVAGGTTLSTTSALPVSIDLATLTSDPDGDPRVHSLPYATSSRGGALSITGSVVTYTPPQANITDGFVYVVSDGRGGTNSAVVAVTVGN